MKALKRVVIITFWMTLCILLFFVIVAGMGKQSDEIASSAASHGPTPTPGTLSEPPLKATEMIFVTNDDGTLSACYLSEIDCQNGMWRLNVIPTDTRIEMSAGLYKTLSRENVAVPQIATLSELYRAFPGNTAPDNCFAALSELINFTPDSRLVISALEFGRIIKNGPENYQYDSFLADGLHDEIRAAGGMMHFIESFLSGKQTSLPIRARLFYLETFENLTNLRISCRLIPGERHNNGYLVRTDIGDFFEK